MARRRMFSLEIIDTDYFLDMPSSSQNLYFHLGMRADDDGFVASPKKIMAMAKAADDDMKLLLTKGFVIPFETGICVIRHWKIHNTIQKDRYNETIHLDEKSLLYLNDNDSYECIQGVYTPDTQVRLGKVSIVKVRKGKSEFVPPTLQEVKNYFKEWNFKEEIAIRAYEYYNTGNWKDSEGKQVLNWKGKMQSVWFKEKNKIKERLPQPAEKEKVLSPYAQEFKDKYIKEGNDGNQT